MDQLETKPQPGRPKGCRTADRAIVISLPPACPSCGSTRREPYRDGVAHEQRQKGEVDGRPYNRIVWRRTRCLDCGQMLTVREFLYEPNGRVEK
jgi:hypothetical protein